MTQFLHPISVSLPSQGSYQFYPYVQVFEENSAAELQTAINAATLVQSLDVNNYWVVEEIEYQVYYKPNPQGGMRYSALVRLTQVQVI